MKFLNLFLMFFVFISIALALAFYLSNIPFKIVSGPLLYWPVALLIAVLILALLLMKQQLGHQKSPHNEFEPEADHSAQEH